MNPSDFRRLGIDVQTAIQQSLIEAVARAEPDGYTLIMATSSTHATNAALYKRLAFNPVRDFTPGQASPHGYDWFEESPQLAVLSMHFGGRLDWLRAGQALNRVLVHAATSWVFAALNSQPMESPPLRALVRSRLGLPWRGLRPGLGRGDS